MVSLAQDQFVTLAGAKIQLHQSGDGAPLLLLHGFEGLTPNPFIERLAGERRILAPSHPGFDRSDLPDWLERPDDIAHLYLDLIDHLELDMFDLVGCSIGGWIAAELATMVPQRIRRLALVAPVGVKTGGRDRLDVPDIFAVSKVKLDEMLFCDPAAGKLVPEKMSDDELGIKVRNRETLALLSWEPYMHNPKLKHRLHRVSCPVLLLRGERDGFVSEEYLQSYASLFRSAQIEVVPRAGHAPELEQPEAFASRVLKFLKSNS